MTNHTQSEPSPYLEPELAAKYLKLSTHTLAGYRVTGGGPRFRKHGRRVLYHQADLDAWSEERAFESTSQESVARA